MSFDQDPNEQANISGADLAILIDDLATLRTALHTQAEEAAKLIEQRDELLAAAKAIMETEFAEMACIGSHASAEHALGLLAAAIDKATN